MKQISNIQLLLIITFIILIIPPLLTNISIFHWFDYSSSGQIGDTIGGITAPFINGLAALLVFITFKEQVKANKLIQEQLYFQHIQEQINRLEDDFLMIPDTVKELDSNIRNQIYEASRTIGESMPYSISINENLLNKISYSIAVFNQTFIMIKNIQSEKFFLKNKLEILFGIIYRRNYSDTVLILNKALEQNCRQNPYIHKIIAQIKELDDLLGKSSI